MRSPYAKGRPYLSGETVTAGKYRCAGCGEVHEVARDKVVNLPVCPRCQNDAWEAA